MKFYTSHVIIKENHRKGVKNTMGRKRKAQIAKILDDTPQHIGTAMIHLEHLGVIVHTKTEGRNSFFKNNLDWLPDEQDENQLTL